MTRCEMQIQKWGVMSMGKNETWAENAKYVNKSIDQLRETMAKIDEKLSALQESVTTVKVKVGILAVSAGGVGSIMVSIIAAYLKQ